MKPTTDIEQTDGEKSRDLELQKINKSVLEICDNFRYDIMRCVNCPIVLECHYPKKRLNSLKEDAKKMSEDIYDEELDLDNSAENTLRAQNKRDYVYNQYIKDNAHKKLQNDRCQFERNEIINNLQKFTEAGYDISDPRVYLIVKELISNVLVVGRANKAFTNLGILMHKDTPGGPVYYNNPLLKIKPEYSKLIIEATESLDRILKSDETVKAANDFTSHLMTQLGIREKKKNEAIKKMISMEPSILEASYDETKSMKETVEIEADEELE